MIFLKHVLSRRWLINSFGTSHAENVSFLLSICSEVSESIIHQRGTLQVQMRLEQTASLLKIIWNFLALYLLSADMNPLDNWRKWHFNEESKTKDFTDGVIRRNSN